MAIAATDMSAADYLATPESWPEHTELIDGTVVVSEPKLPHTRVQGSIYRQLWSWADAAEGRGYVGLPTDVVIDDRNVYAPDVWWVGEHRVPAEDQLDLDGVPDLVVEIRSPSTWGRDLSVKLPAYEAAGVAEAWYVDTVARSVLVFRRSHADAATFDVTTEITGDEELSSPLLPGFPLALGLIFAR